MVLATDWGRCNYDIRHAFKTGYVYDLPFGRGRQFGGDWHPAANALLGGWAVEGLIQLQTGTPSNIQLGTDWANVGWGQQRPNVVSNPNVDGRRDPDRMFNTDAFKRPQQYTYGNAAPYMVFDDGRYIWDISILKKFPIRERHDLEFRAEFFNLPNHVNFNIGKQQSLSSATFGTTTSATTERQIQFVLRYEF